MSHCSKASSVGVSSHSHSGEHSACDALGPVPDRAAFNNDESCDILSLPDDAFSAVPKRTIWKHGFLEQLKQKKLLNERVAGGVEQVREEPHSEQASRFVPHAPTSPRASKEMKLVHRRCGVQLPEERSTKKPSPLVATPPTGPCPSRMGPRRAQLVEAKLREVRGK